MPKLLTLALLLLYPFRLDLMTVAGTVGLAGTRGYVAPEFNDGKRGVKTDVFSYGIVSVHIM